MEVLAAVYGLEDAGSEAREEFFTEVTLPAVDRGRTDRPSRLGLLEVLPELIVCCGRDAAEQAGDCRRVCIYMPYAMADHLLVELVAALRVEATAVVDVDAVVR